MKGEWVGRAMELARMPTQPSRDVDELVFYSGARKIITGVQFTLPNLANDMTIGDCGFTKSKLTMLRRLYYHEESHAKAVELWERRLGQGKYGSVGFTCYNHLLKSDPDKKSKRASVMGPCIQSVTLTLLNDGSVNVDAFYRTTEIFKKFPADLVFLRDQLLPAFKIDDMNRVMFHMANVTCHPMYFVTLIPLMGVSRSILELESIKVADKRFFDWTIKWTARYICDEHHRGIAKFAQALRVAKDARERITGAEMTKLQAYVRDNHPGHRNEYEEDEDEE